MEDEIKGLIKHYQGLIGMSKLMMHEATNNDDIIKLEAGNAALNVVIEDLEALI